MSLSDKLKRAALEEIKNNHQVILNLTSPSIKKILSFLHSEGILDDESIELALEKAVIKQARQAYEYLTRRSAVMREYADHIPMQEFFAYALHKGVFSKEEIKKIPFDHGMNPKSYYKFYGKKDLISGLKNELLS